MALFQIGNDKLTIQVDSMGAELKSLKKITTGVEFMWNGNPAFWKRTSPVLFPLVGALKNGEYRLNGQCYQMGQHGFARDMEFQLKSQTNREIWFALESSMETLEVYPYAFLLELGYELQDDTLSVKWKVTNRAKEEMYFSIGGHPAFRCPIVEDTKQTHYRIRFDTKKEVCAGILQGGLMSDKKVIYPLENGEMRITEHLFDNDALVIEDNQAHQVSLIKPDGTPYLTVDFDAPLFGVWSPPGKNAPFICIEPWYGRCDAADYTGTWKERKWEQYLDAGSVFEASYRIRVS
ncbi:MAG: aldose 1-epimerase family protein [Bacillus sp. (in: Bacteria)]|nr:aldose 1-epimerase family protein [Bacillus sp. (in: firmicutes)]MCM1425081.1 aldose 1-epimerase family protein [Eubacterium sp.]